MAMIQQLLCVILLSQMLIFPADGIRSDFCADKNTSLYADPDDCSSFYQCFLRYSYHFNCPTGLFYNENVSLCDWPVNVICGQRNIPSINAATVNPTSGPSSNAQTSLPQSTPSNTVRNNVTGDPNTPLTSFCQTRSNKLYADPEKCSRFYQCNNGFTYHLKCPPDLVFNPEMQYCDWTYNVNCSIDYDDISPDVYNRSHIYNQTGNAVDTTLSPTRQARDCGKVVCYFPNWAIFRSGVEARFGPDDINTDLCTHVIYAFATLQGNRLVASNTSDEASGSDIGNFVRATNLKIKNPNLKVLLAVGGWAMEPSLFSNMAASDGSIAEFVTTTIDFLRRRNFDGLSLDWSSLAERSSIYKERHTRLSRELRRAFENEASGERRLLLTGAVSGSKNAIDTMYDIPQLVAAFDIINVLSYDLHGTWDGKTGHGSPLKAGKWESVAEATLNVEWVANYWASQGAPKNKLTIGVPLYGRSYTLSSSSRNYVGAPIRGPGLPGKYTTESGYLSYYEICSIMNNSTKYIIDDQRVPYLVSGDQWVGYEDPASVREKVKLIKGSGFAGIMVWDLSLDDFGGRFCGQGSFPLMNAILSQCVP